MCVWSVQVTAGRPGVQKQGGDRRGTEKETRSESNGGTDYVGPHGPQNKDFGLY